jgi:hypothetical protein
MRPRLTETSSLDAHPSGLRRLPLTGFLFEFLQWAAGHRSGPAPVIEPIRQVDRGVLHRFGIPPGAPSADQSVLKSPDTDCASALSRE